MNLIFIISFLMLNLYRSTKFQSSRFDVLITIGMCKTNKETPMARSETVTLYINPYLLYPTSTQIVNLIWYIIEFEIIIEKYVPLFSCMAPLYTSQEFPQCPQQESRLLRPFTYYKPILTSKCLYWPTLSFIQKVVPFHMWFSHYGESPDNVHFLIIFISKN